MADTDISSHQANTTDIEQPRKDDGSIEKTALNGDDSELKDADPSQVVGWDDEAAIPKGTIDPVYEAKARVLNHAVCMRTICKFENTERCSDSRDWYGMVSMAALYCCRIRLGK
jgi:hypothetical protein